MNILYVPTKDPRLKNGGNEQRTNLLWESLKRHGKVYTFLLDSKLETDVEMIDGEHPIYKFRYINKRHSLWRIVNSLFCRLSFFSIYNKKTVQIKSLEKVLVNLHFDIVVTRYIYPLNSYGYWNIAPLLIDIDDHPYQVYETTRKKKMPLGLKTIGRFVTKWQVKQIICKSIGGWIANEEQLYLCGENYEFLPNIPQMPSDAYDYDYSERKNLFTVGAMGYEPNKEGVSRFLKQIWPVFHQKYPDVRYYIIGKGASEIEANLWNSYEGVTYLGFVEDLEAMYEKTLATVVPVYSGGGTCIKTLESMAYSRPCISTIFGARGQSDNVIEQEKGMLVFDDAMSFIKAFEKVQCPNRRKKIESLGRDVILHQYTADSYKKAVDRVLLKMKIEE